MMFDTAFAAIRPFLHRLDPETAHLLTLKTLSLLPVSSQHTDDKGLMVSAFGKHFPNPLGLAAGFDKQCEAPDALLSLGFGFVECGGVTPLAQAGNPKPRVFRLPRDAAIVNRFGLNSQGLETVATRLERRQGRPGLVGVNLGANKDSSDRIGDYTRMIGRLCGLADFLTLNVSSPNTPGLRDLQGEAFLDELLARALAARDEADRQGGFRTAILLKIAPDLDPTALDGLIETALRRGIDGMIVSNTTVRRPDHLQEKALAHETGGLSGAPLFKLSTKMLAQSYLRIEGKIPLIGVGGIDSPEAAFTKILAGASLLQLYTALAYQGPGLIGRIKTGLLDKLEGRPVSALTGKDAALLAQTT